jgi:hypothetical protein
MGSVSVGDVEPSVAWVEKTFDEFTAGGGYWLAANRIQDVLAMELPPPAWSTCQRPGIGPTHPPNVERLPDLKSGPHSLDHETQKLS